MNTAVGGGTDTTKRDYQTIKTRLNELRKLCKDQAYLIELLKAQLKNKEQMIAASDQVIEQIIRSHQREEQ